MIPHFSDPGQVHLLQQEIDAWLGTPFIARSAIKKGGCDCVRFSHAVLQGLGLVPPVTWPDYPIRPVSDAPYWALRRATEFLPGISLVFAAAVQPPADGVTIRAELPPLLPGDGLIFSSGRAFHHTALVRDGVRFAHCLPELGVVCHSLHDDVFLQKLRAVYRLMRAEK